MKEMFEVVNWNEVEEYEDIKVFRKTSKDIKREAYMKKKWAKEREAQKQWRLSHKG